MPKQQTDTQVIVHNPRTCGKTVILHQRIHYKVIDDFISKKEPTQEQKEWVEKSYNWLHKQTYKGK